MKQLISGVEHMHKEYVIHRDLKTSNLLFSHNGVLKVILQQKKVYKYKIFYFFRLEILVWRVNLGSH